MKLSRIAKEALFGSFVRLGAPYDPYIIPDEDTVKELVREGYLTRSKDTHSYVWTRFAVDAIASKAVR